ncbi:hypothetical protein AAFC00_003690 [Neodothiora populina]|uniref:HhH-GPD domain-containing protein n=1 Tax=Neodothiora populina TaxID=2781224 RepID=A0ABR3PF34_9PEZI
MAPQRRTRASAASTKEPQQLSSPPITPAPSGKRQTRQKKQTPSSTADAKSKVNKSSVEDPKTSGTRKRTRDSEENDKVLDELPHGLGDIPTPEASDEATKVKSESSPPAKKRARRSSQKVQVKAESEDVKELAEKADLIKTEDDKGLDVKSDPTKSEIAPKTKSGKAAAKNNKYGFMPGQTPYPDWPHPTSEECYEVDRILSKVHGKVKKPESIPVPSVTVAGCGEVPSVLDALIRTRLSAATTGTNSSRAFQGLVKTFGTIKEGVGKGSVDWNKVRLASQREVFEAIKSGGLAQMKSKDIKAILEITYQENQARRNALKEEQEAADSGDKTAASQAGPAGSENEPAEEKESEIARAESNVLSLDHLHLMETQAAIDRMSEFPGIGPKTASCVALFCLRRPSFAVDTHVFRLVQYLGWVPPPNEVKKGEPRVGRESAYKHCELRVPDDLKYPLHQLLIKHGKVCPRCKAATTTASAEWSNGCPIEHLVTRFEPKKNGRVSGDGEESKTGSKSTPKKKGAKGGKKQAKDNDSEEEELAESSGLSDADSDLEDSPPAASPPRRRAPRQRAAKAKVTEKKGRGKNATKKAAEEFDEDDDEEDESSAASDVDSEFEE